MPKNYSRVEVRFSRKNRLRLDKMKKEAREEAGRFVSTSDVVEAIVERFFEKEEQKRLQE